MMRRNSAIFCIIALAGVTFGVLWQQTDLVQGGLTVAENRVGSGGTADEGIEVGKVENGNPVPSGKKPKGIKWLKKFANSHDGENSDVVGDLEEGIEPECMSEISEDVEGFTDFPLRDKPCARLYTAAGDGSIWVVGYGTEDKLVALRITYPNNPSEAKIEETMTVASRGKKFIKWRDDKSQELIEWKVSEDDSGAQLQGAALGGAGDESADDDDDGDQASVEQSPDDEQQESQEVEVVDVLSTDPESQTGVSPSSKTDEEDKKPSSDVEEKKASPVGSAAKKQQRRPIMSNGIMSLGHVYLPNKKAEEKKPSPGGQKQEEVKPEEKTVADKGQGKEKATTNNFDTVISNRDDIDDMLDDFGI